MATDCNNNNNNTRWAVHEHTQFSHSPVRRLMDVRSLLRAFSFRVQLVFSAMGNVWRSQQESNNNTKPKIKAVTSPAQPPAIGSGNNNNNNKRSLFWLSQLINCCLIINLLSIRLEENEDGSEMAGYDFTSSTSSPSAKSKTALNFNLRIFNNFKLISYSFKGRRTKEWR